MPVRSVMRQAKPKYTNIQRMTTPRHPHLNGNTARRPAPSSNVMHRSKMESGAGRRDVYVRFRT
jgi:hypothetical protein